VSKVVGVIGGMGPAATAHFMQELVDASPAERDQDHIRVVIDSNGSVPDRVAAILHGGPSPGPVLADMARRLEGYGAELLVMPCNTAHVWEDDIRNAITVPFLSIIGATVDSSLAHSATVRRVGLLATSGCLTAGLYQSAYSAAGLETVELPAARLPAFMDSIASVKGGRPPQAAVAQVEEDAAYLVASGAEVIVAACTEVPLLLAGRAMPVPLVSSTSALAMAVVAAATL
jgi:aspartate racemase